MLDGSESWETHWATDGRYAYRTSISNLLISTSGDGEPLLYSNNFSPNTINNIFNLSVVAYGIGKRTNQSQVIIRKDDTTTIDNFEAWLSTHNTDVYYVLATPQYIKITDYILFAQLEAIYNALSMQGVTNISQKNNDLPFNITATALEAI